MKGETMSYSYAVLDPRPQSAEARRQFFIRNLLVLGIEVTVPELAAKCTLGNIDPQHSGGNTGLAAIEVAFKERENKTLPDGATLVTVRPDLDSVGAMALFSLSAQGRTNECSEERVLQVAVADKFARGGWPGPKSLPTRGNPWTEESATAELSRPLAAIAAAVSDFKIPLDERVATMERWLTTGKEPQQYRTQVEKERLDTIVALETGAITVMTVVEGRVAVVESTHRAGTTIGYSQAPVVVALNPEFRVQGGEPHRKFTVCQFQTGFVNLGAALAELRQLEEGWGGSPTIIGSPQGVGSTLTTEQVVEIVSRHLS